jgi:hypothetical protein
METRMCFEFYHGLADISILSRVMIYFDFNMSKSTNTVVYFAWKTVIYIYACGKCRTQFMLPMEKSVTFKYMSHARPLIFMAWNRHKKSIGVKIVLLAPIITSLWNDASVFTSVFNMWVKYIGTCCQWKSQLHSLAHVRMRLYHR